MCGDVVILYILYKRSYNRTSAELSVTDKYNYKISYNRTSSTELSVTNRHNYKISYNRTSSSAELSVTNKYNYKRSYNRMSAELSVTNKYSTTSKSLRAGALHQAGGSLRISTEKFF